MVQKKKKYFEVFFSFGSLVKNLFCFITVPLYWMNCVIKYCVNTIKKIIEYKTDFFFWVITSFGIALFGLWLPLIIDGFKSINSTIQMDNTLYADLLKNNPYIMYSITFLAETLLSTLLNFIDKESESNAIPKLIMGLIVLFYLIVLSVLAYEYRSTEMPSSQQHLILIITILLGILLYPLKAHLREKSAEIVEKEENANVESIVVEASKEQEKPYVEEGVVYLS